MAKGNPLPYKEVHTILDNVMGHGHYVGTYIAWGVNNNGWWGEGEIKFYLDGDKVGPRSAEQERKTTLEAPGFEHPKGEYGIYSTPSWDCPR